MGDITELSERQKSIINFKKRVQKKGIGQKGFEGFEDKDSFNEMLNFG